MLSGYFFRHFFQHDLLFARDQLQTHLGPSTVSPLERLGWPSSLFCSQLGLNFAGSI